MKLHSLFQEENVQVQSEATSLREAVAFLLAPLEEQLEGVDLEELAEQILRREKARPEAGEDEVCILHLRGEEFSHAHVSAAILQEPVPHPTDEGRNISIVFLVLAPQLHNTAMLQTLAALARLTSSKSFTSSIQGIRSASRFIRLVEESGAEVKLTLTAGDIMEPIERTLDLDTSLVEAIDALAKAPDEGLPVLDDRGNLTGEITTKEFIQLGMPKYMELLANPDMLESFEPFENYFANEQRLRVRDICRRDFIGVPPSEQILRVAHLMITQNRRRIYVQNDEKILGVIYRKSILTRVMNQ